jgi:hypothetical protein
VNPCDQSKGLCAVLLVCVDVDSFRLDRGDDLLKNNLRVKQKHESNGTLTLISMVLPLRSENEAD